MKIKYLLFIVIVSILVYSGCDTKKEDTYDQSKTLLPRDTSMAVDTTGPADTIRKETYQEPVLDITGRWNGKFDDRDAVLTITSQDSMNFSGSITVNYRDKINQQVKGTFDPATKKFAMNDQLHSRFSGKYSGKLNDDGDKMDGTFTMNLDGSKKNFSFNKSTR